MKGTLENNIRELGFPQFVVLQQGGIESPSKQ